MHNYIFDESSGEIFDLDNDGINFLINSNMIKWNIEHNMFSFEHKYLSVVVNRLQNQELIVHYNTDSFLSFNKNPRISSLICNKKELKHLSGLNNFPNLKYIDCSNNKLTNLSGIEKLKKLEILICKNNNLFEIDSIENSKELKTLVCSDNRIVSLNVLSKLKNLKTLNASKNNILIVKLSLPNLISLDISDSNIKFLDVSELPELIELNINDNNITYLYGLDKLKKLKKLYCKNNNFSDHQHNKIIKFCEENEITLRIDKI